MHLIVAGIGRWEPEWAKRYEPALERSGVSVVHFWLSSYRE